MWGSTAVVMGDKSTSPNAPLELNEVGSQGTLIVVSREASCCGGSRQWWVSCSTASTKMLALGRTLPVSCFRD